MHRWCGLLGLLALVVLAQGASAQDICTGLEAFWTLDEDGVSTTSADQTGHGHLLTLGAGVAAPAWLTGVGNCGGTGDPCLGFDGTDDFASMTAIPLSTTFTYAAWIYLVSAGAHTYSVLIENVDTSIAFYVMGTGGNLGKLNAWYSVVEHFSTGTVPFNTWAHVAIVVSAGSLTFYINSVPAGTAVAVPAFSPTKIGWECLCRMEDIRLYAARALTQAEISAVATGGSCGGTPRRSSLY
jgi:hypothetical protein